MSKKIVSERLELTKAINNLSKCQISFAEAVKTIEALNEETLTQLDLAINDKKNELDRLTGDFDIERKNLQIALDQEIKQYGYDKAVELIGGQGQTVKQILMRLKRLLKRKVIGEKLL